MFSKKKTECRVCGYMKDGKGYPLNYCPSCGKRVKNE